MAEITQIEHQIITGLLNGDDRSMALVYDHYGAAIFGLCKRMLQDVAKAEEAFQEAMVKIWQGGAGYDQSKGRLYTWMINITRNTCVDHIRKENRRIQIQDVGDDVYKVESHHKTDLPVDHIGLKKQLEKLRKEDRQVLELAYFMGYTQDEIAKELRIPLGTVKTRARKALNELKAILRRDIGR